MGFDLNSVPTWGWVAAVGVIMLLLVAKSRGLGPFAKRTKLTTPAAGLGTESESAAFTFLEARSREALLSRKDELARRKRDALRQVTEQFAQETGAELQNPSPPGPASTSGS